MINLEGLISLIAVIYLVTAIILPIFKGMFKSHPVPGTSETPVQPSAGGGPVDSGEGLADMGEDPVDTWDGPAIAGSDHMVYCGSITGTPAEGTVMTRGWTGEGESSELAFIDEEWNADFFQDNLLMSGPQAEDTTPATGQPRAMSPEVADLLSPAGVPVAIILGEVISRPRSKGRSIAGSQRWAFRGR